MAFNITGRDNSISSAGISQFPIYTFEIRRLCSGSSNEVQILGKLSTSIVKLIELKIFILPFVQFRSFHPIHGSTILSFAKGERSLVVKPIFYFFNLKLNVLLSKRHCFDSIMNDKFNSVSLFFSNLYISCLHASKRLTNWGF